MGIWDDKAVQLGIDPRGKPIFEVIRLIQIKEGFQPCFATKHFKCKEYNCLWWKQCQGLIRIVEIV